MMLHRSIAWSVLEQSEGYDATRLIRDQGGYEGNPMSLSRSLYSYNDARGLFRWLHYFHVDVMVVAFALTALAVTGFMASPGRIGWGRLIGGPETVGGREAVGPVRGAQADQRLTPSLRAAMDLAAQRYRVSAAALVPVFEAAQNAGREFDVDPMLLVAVVAVESRFNPISESPMGAQGLMQVIPRYHADKISPAAGQLSILDPVTNIKVGAQILREAIRRQGSVQDGLQYYAGAADDLDKTYASKVLAEKSRFEQAGKRKEAAV